MRRLWLLAALFFVPQLSIASTKDSKDIELIIDVKNEFYIGAFPSEVHMKINPFTFTDDSAKITIPVKWDLNKHMRITAQHTCTAENEKICEVIYISLAEPSVENGVAYFMTVDRHQQPVTDVLTKNQDLKVDNPTWVVKFSSWGTPDSGLEAKIYRSNFRVTFEGDI